MVGLFFALETPLNTRKSKIILRKVKKDLEVKEIYFDVWQQITQTKTQTMKYPEIKYGVLEGKNLKLFPKSTSVETTAEKYLWYKIREGGFAKAGKRVDQIRAYIKDWEEYYNEMALEYGDDMYYDIDTVIDQIADHLTHSEGMLIDREKRATASKTDQEVFTMTIEKILRVAH